MRGLEFKEKDANGVTFCKLKNVIYSPQTCKYRFCPISGYTLKYFLIQYASFVLIQQCMYKRNIYFACLMRKVPTSNATSAQV